MPAILHAEDPFPGLRLAEDGTRRVLLLKLGPTTGRAASPCPWRGLGPGLRLTRGTVDEVDVTSGRVVLADPVNADLLAFRQS